MFKRLAALGAIVAILALAPTAYADHRDGGVAAETSLTVVAPKAITPPGEERRQRLAEECGGLLALLVALGLEVEVLDFAELDLKGDFSATPGA